MYKIESSYCDAFKSEVELNEVIAKYVELRAKDRFAAMDFIAPFRGKMNTEGKSDLQSVLDAAFESGFKLGDKSVEVKEKTKEQAFIDEKIAEFGYEVVYKVILDRHDGDTSAAEKTMTCASPKSEKWFNAISTALVA